jgi:UDP-N-acetyl-D-mannosaminuronic acid dehydrogenase
LSLKAFRSEEICDAIRSKKLRIGVFGLGWMGISTACLFLQTGAVVVGADVDANVVELLNSGKSPINEPGVKPIIAKYAGSTFKATTDVRSASEQSDILIIIVPTSIDSDKKPDYTALEKVSREIGMKLRKGSLVIIESTVGPGVTESIVKPILEKYSGLTAGDGFLLAYSPIRGMAGKALEDIRKYPRIVGGLDPNSLRAASAVMGTIVEGGIVSVSDIRTAEAAKLFENVYRDVNIAKQHSRSLIVTFIFPGLVLVGIVFLSTLTF